MNDISSSDLGIREAAFDDADAVITLWEECGLTRPWNDPAHDVAFALNGETSTILVGLIDESDPFVATVMTGHDGHRGWIYYLAIALEYQRYGYGKSMVAAAEAWLADQGVKKVQLMVRTENSGVSAFYEKLGYADQNVQVLGRWL